MAAAAVSALVVMATPAAAHTVSGSEASNFLTRYEGLDHQIAGLHADVVEKGNRFEVTNRTGEELIVLGYEGEPYLRVDSRGVFQNLRSPATYLNEDRQASIKVPPKADASARPEWVRVDDGPTARWHDHRIHWMGSRNPPAVRRAPDQFHVVIENWTIPMTVGGEAVQAKGDLVWKPGPNPAPLVAVMVVLGLAVVALAFSPVWAPALALVTAVLVAVDIYHLVGAGLATAGTLGERWGAVAAGGYYAVIGWAAGAIAVRSLMKGKVDGLFAAGFAGALVAFFGGVLDISDLSRSQLLFVSGSDVARALVMVSLGAGAGLTVASVVAVRRHGSPSGTSASDSVPAPDPA